MQAVALKILLACCQRLAVAVPWERLSLVATPLAQLLWWGLPKRRAITIDNLQRALGLSEDAATRLAKRVFHHVVLTALEFLRMGAEPQEAVQRVRLVGLEEAKAAWEKHGGLILLTGHLGNFELLGARLAQEFPLWVIARPQNPAVWRTIKRIREKVGMRVLEKFGSVREALQILRKGGVLGLLADQHAGEGSNVVIVPFFGRPVSVFKTPALLAARMGLPIVFCYDLRQRDGSHVGILHPPQFVRDVEATALWYCQQLEQVIRQAPEQWWWLHDRWKAARSRERRMLDGK